VPMKARVTMVSSHESWSFEVQEIRGCTKMRLLFAGKIRIALLAVNNPEALHAN
jgi:hypothetical protein